MLINNSPLEFGFTTPSKPFNRLSQGPNKNNLLICLGLISATLSQVEAASLRGINPGSEDSLRHASAAKFSYLRGFSPHGEHIDTLSFHPLLALVLGAAALSLMASRAQLPAQPSPALNNLEIEQNMERQPANNNSSLAQQSSASDGIDGLTVVCKSLFLLGVSGGCAVAGIALADKVSEKFFGQYPDHFPQAVRMARAMLGTLGGCMGLTGAATVERLSVGAERSLFGPEFLCSSAIFTAGIGLAAGLSFNETAKGSEPGSAVAEGLGIAAVVSLSLFMAYFFRAIFSGIFCGIFCLNR